MDPCPLNILLKVKVKVFCFTSTSERARMPNNAMKRLDDHVIIRTSCHSWSNILYSGKFLYTFNFVRFRTINFRTKLNSVLKPNKHLHAMSVPQHVPKSILYESTVCSFALKSFRDELKPLILSSTCICACSQKPMMFYFCCCLLQTNT